MTKNRMEAFSDGVLAIVITIAVLELRSPAGAALENLIGVLPLFLSYVLSFVFLGIYWNNHHHLMQAVERVDGSVLWANLHLLFWLSLIPFVTRWMGENEFASLPVALYGIVLFFAGFAYYLLTQVLFRLHGRDSNLAGALEHDWKEKASLLLYAIAIPLALQQPLLSGVLYVLVAVLWLIPDRRIEAALGR